jgi:hypothetical protein
MYSRRVWQNSSGLAQTVMSRATIVNMGKKKKFRFL